MDLNYAVTFYLHFSKTGFPTINGVMVRGWPDNDTVERILQAWDIPKLTSVYLDKIAWLTSNPGFKRVLVPKAAQKRVYASQTDL